MRRKIGDALAALDILDARLTDKSVRDLDNDSVLMDACAYRICVLGEAVNSALFVDRANANLFRREPLPTDMGWDELVQVRNMFIHRYGMLAGQAVHMFKRGINHYRLGLRNVLAQVPTS